MAKRRMGLIALLLCICLMPWRALAVSTADAKAPISPDRACSLTLCYGVAGQRVQLYKIAEVSADFQYTLTEAFAYTNLVLNGIQTNGEWDVIRSTLEVQLVAEGIAPTVAAETDEAGQICFDRLQPGLYLVSGVQTEGYVFSSALVALPGLDSEGDWQYDLTVTPKGEPLPPVEPDEEISLKVLKLWKGDKGSTQRPKSIEVEIFRNGTAVETVVLSEENNWSYSWTAKNDGARWQVVERNVPPGYTMTVEQRETAFVLTNTLDSEEPEPPKTGDTAGILVYTLPLYAAGGLLVVLGLTGKRKRHEETN